MLVHKLVFEKLYFALTAYVVSHDLKGKTPQSSKSRKYSLKSMNFWSVVIVDENNREKHSLVSSITKDPHTSYWTYYRLLTNYETPSCKKVVGEYQDIDGIYISSALKHIEYIIPNHFRYQIDDTFNELVDKKKIHEAEGEILLELYIKDKWPELKLYLKPKINCYQNCIFDDSIKETKTKLKDEGLYRRSHSTSRFPDLYSRNYNIVKYDHIYPKHAYEFVIKYYNKITLSDFSAAFEFWIPSSRKELWNDNYLNFAKEHCFNFSINSIIVENIEIKIEELFIITIDMKVIVNETVITSSIPKEYRVAGWPPNKTKFTKVFKNGIEAAAETFPLKYVTPYIEEIIYVPKFCNSAGLLRQELKLTKFKNSTETFERLLLVRLFYDYFKHTWYIISIRPAES